jgi:hypothetical protein
MKNSIFTKYSWILALCAFTFTSALYVACTKDIKAELPQQPTEINISFSPRDQAESLAKTVYNHLKFYSLHKSEEYLNPAIREQVMENVAKVNDAYRGLSPEQSLQKALSDKTMTPSMAQSMRDFMSVVDVAKADATIEDVEAHFRIFEEKIYSNKELSDDEKLTVGSISASLRLSMRFVDEMNKGRVSAIRGNTNAQLRWCLFGRLADCFGFALFKTGVTGFVAGAVTGGTGAASALLVGLISNIISVYFDSNCACDNGSTQGLTCFQIQTLNPVVSASSICSPTVGLVVTGIGPLPTSFTWSALWTDATGEHTLNDLNNKITPGPAVPAFTIPDPNQNYKIRVTPFGCSPQDFNFKLNDVIGDPGSVVVSGEYNHSVGGTSVFHISGSCLFNPSNQFSWQQPGVGSIISGGNTADATIKFTTKSCYSGGGYGGGYGGSSACFPVYITAYSTNPCLTNRSNGGSFGSIKVY